MHVNVTAKDIEVAKRLKKRNRVCNTKGDCFHYTPTSIVVSRMLHKPLVDEGTWLVEPGSRHRVRTSHELSYQMFFNLYDHELDRRHFPLEEPYSFESENA